MHILYRSEKKIRASELFDGRLERYGVHEHRKGLTEPDFPGLTDGHNFVWVRIDSDGLTHHFTKFRSNVPDKILRAIAAAFDMTITSERGKLFVPPKAQRRVAA